MSIVVLKSNREKEKGFGGTGILPVILNGQAGSLSYHSILRSDPFVAGTKLLKTAIRIFPPGCVVWDAGTIIPLPLALDVTIAAPSSRVGV